MRSYTVTEFRENLASALDLASEELVIVRRNGREYEIRPRQPAQAASMISGLDVSPVATGVETTLESLLEDLQAARTRRGD